MAERGEAGKPAVALFADLGTRLRHARKMKGLRLNDVARIVGCSESLLSKIETNKAAPSLHTLHRIAAVLDATVAELFSDPASSGLTVYAPDTRPEILLDPDAGPDGEAAHEPLRLQRLIPHTEGRVLNANIHVVPPECGIGGALKHEGEEVGYVLEGCIDLTVDGETKRLTAGMSFFFRSTVPHSYRNPGPDEAKILWVNTPPY